MKPKPFEIIVEFIPQSTRTGITYEAHKKGSLIRCKDCKYNLRNPRKWNDDDEVFTYIQCKFMNPDDYCSFAKPKETS